MASSANHGRVSGNSAAPGTESWPLPRWLSRSRVAVALLLLLLGVGAGLVFVASASAAPITYVDDHGADDEPGQKDLNFLTVDYGVPGATSVDVDWGWDDTGTTGNNTLDGCALFDTDRDGFANYSFCVVVSPAPAVLKLLYTCGDAASDRCTNPRSVIP